MKAWLVAPVLVLFVVSAQAVSVRADTVALLPIADTTLHAGFPTHNMGAHDRLLAGIDGLGDPRRALLQFDIAGNIEPLATINSATLTLIVPDGNVFNPSTFALHRVLVEWGEGSGTTMAGSPAAVGDATWNSRMHNIANWGSPGGQSGTDYIGTASATTMVSGFGSYDWTGLAADVQLWLDSPGENHGWFLMTQSAVNQTARRFGSREAGAGLVPVLTIDYTPIPEPGTFFLAALALAVIGARRRRTGRV